LTELLFKNISLLIKVCKDSQFKVEVVVFTTILRLIGIELGQVSQLPSVSPCLSGLDACDLSDKRVLLIDEGVLVCILSSGSITVRNLGFKRAPVCKIDLEATLTRSLNLIKWIGYEAGDLIEFEGGKGSSGSDLFLDFLFSLFCRVLLI
jgi:hypothetical protein